MHRNKIFLITLLHVSLFHPSAFSQQTETNLITPIKIWQFSQKTPQALLIEWNQKRLSKQSAAESAWKNMEMSFDLGYKKNSSPGTLWSIGLSQEIPVWGQTKAKQSVLAGQSALLKNELILVRWQVAFDAIEKAHQIFLLEKWLVMHNQRMQRFQLMRRFLESRPTLSPQKKVEKELILSQMHSVENSIVETKIRIWRFKKELKDTIPDLPDHPISFPWYKTTGITNLTNENIINNFINNNSLLKILLQQKNNLQREIQLQQSLSYANPSLRVQYAQEPADIREQIISGGISFPLTIHRENKSELIRLQHEQKQIDLQIELKKRELLREWQSVTGRISLFKNLLQKEDEKILKLWTRHLQFSEREFRTGRVSLMEFYNLDSQICANVEKAFEHQQQFLSLLLRLLFLSGSENDMLSFLKHQ